MQVVSLAPVPVASLAWRVGDGAWALGVVCKLTFQLNPGQAKLAKRHDPIYERDRFPDGDKQASLYAPSDLVPTRPLTDVTLVGSVYAPRGKPTSALDARVRIQSIDKSLHVEAAPGSRGKPFKSAPLGYEYAEPSANNPVGTSLDGGSYPHATRILANVDPTETNPGHTSPGFGPIPGHWSARRAHLTATYDDGDEPTFDEGSGPYTLPHGLDLSFFNAAPPDQQLPELLPNVEIVLDNLHPDHPELTTRLPNVAPQVFVERKGASRREEYDTRITALWIDTRRAIATITWHAQVHLDAADEPGRAWVAVAGPGTRLSLTQLTRLIGTLSRRPDDHATSAPEDEETTDETGGDLLGQTVSMKAKDRHRLQEALGKAPEVTKTSVLSSDHLLGEEDTERGRVVGGRKADASGRQAPKSSPDGPKSRPPERPASSPPRPSAPPPRPSAPPKPRTPPKKRRPPESGEPAKIDHLADVIDPSERTADGIPAATDDSPAWLAKGSREEGRSPSVPPPPPKRSRPGSAPPPAPGAPPFSSVAPPIPARRGTAITHPGLGPASAGSAAAAAWPTTHVVPNRDDRLADTSNLPGAETTEPDGDAIAPHDRKAKRDRIPDEVIELLWFDGDATKRLRKSWPELCDRLEFEPRDDRHDSSSDDPAEARRHHLHFGVLTEARTNQVSELRHALREAISASGRFTPPLVVLKGTLRFPFDAIETLRATAATVKPVSGDDKKLEEALQQVDELLQTPLVSGNTETVKNFTKHLRTLYQDSRRSLSIEYLDETVERMLLEQRRYQRRTLFGGPCIRALLATRKDDKGLPTYLPDDLADKLPMMTSFEARIVAEGHVRQDQYEAHPHALRVVTLGRLIRFD